MKDSHMEDEKLILKVLQIFYINGSQMIIVESEQVVNEIYLKYTWITPDQNQKIAITSRDSFKRYCLDTKYIASMVVTDPDDMVEDVDSSKNGKDDEPWSV